MLRKGSYLKTPLCTIALISAEKKNGVGVLVLQLCLVDGYGYKLPFILEGIKYSKKTEGKLEDNRKEIKIESSQ